MILPETLHVRITLIYSVLVFLGLGILVCYSVYLINSIQMREVEERLNETTVMLVQDTESYLSGGIELESLDHSATQIGKILNAQVTIINNEGYIVIKNHEALGSVSNTLSLNSDIALAISEDVNRQGVQISEDGEGTLYGIASVFVDEEEVGVVVLQVSVSTIKKRLLVTGIIIGLVALLVAFSLIIFAFLWLSKSARAIRILADSASLIADSDSKTSIIPTSIYFDSDMYRVFSTMVDTIRFLRRDSTVERNKVVALLDTMADGVLIVASDDTVVLRNRAAEWLLGIRIENAIGKVTLLEIVRDHEIQRLVSRTLESGRIQLLEVEILANRRLLRAIATPITNPDSSRGVMLMLHDLTSIRQLEVTRREFFSNVSHELRNPLASIKAMVETLEDDDIRDTGIESDFLGRIHVDVDRMTNMINDLLVLSRLESGQDGVHLVPMDISPIIEDLMESYEKRSKEEGVSLHAEIPPQLPLLVGEEGMLRQVLINLLDNAFKFTAEGGEIWVSVLPHDNFLEIEVRDTGEGIAVEHIPHVFERFYKVDRSRRSESTGLGLSIVKHIVESQGGTITVESVQGKGCSFIFTLKKATG